MPKFRKTLEEVEPRFDKWLYVIRNLNRPDRVPDKLRERVFEKLFQSAEIAIFTPDQIRFYEDSLMYYQALKNSLNTAKEEGNTEGKVDESIEMILARESIEKINKYTGLTQQQLEKLK